MSRVVSQAISGPTKDRVVFETFGHGGQASNVGTVDATCRTLTRCERSIRYVTTNAADGRTYSTNPAWSPDSTRIAMAEWTQPADGDFTRTDWYSDIFTISPDGSDRALLTQGDEWSLRPDWGPDSRTLACTAAAGRGADATTFAASGER